MTSITCDSCNKVVANAHRGENYYTYLTRDLCAACHKEMLNAVQDTLEPTRPSYSFEVYKRQLVATLNQFCK